MCGGTYPCRLPRLPHCGLSPRVRGNRQSQSPIVARARSIPACAGEPDTSLPHVNHAKVYPACAGEPPAISLTTGIIKVYPRVCGGTRPTEGCNRGAAGLSPRVRGNLLHPLNTSVKRWSIPACAGEPPFRPYAPPFRRVYPRVCGGTYISTPYIAYFTGLSPRVRGNHVLRRHFNRPCRSIPACAGEPPSTRPSR